MKIIQRERPLMHVSQTSIVSLLSALVLCAGSINHALAADYNLDFVDSSGSLNSLEQSLSILDNPGSRPTTSFTSPQLNLNGGGSSGNFGGDDDFPYDNTFALRAQSELNITETGTYTFGVNSDDGVRLSIDGNIIINDDVLRPATDSFATVNLNAGSHSIEVIFFENGGNANLELFAAAGTHNSFNRNFSLLNDILGPPVDPITVAHVEGLWEPVMDWPLVAVSMANLPDGRILTYSGSERRTWPTTEQTYSATWDPVTNQFDETLHLGHNMFCGAMSMLEDGRVFVNGGRNQTNSPWTSVYDFESGNWQRIQNMSSGGRWYPTTLALGDGQIFTAMGVSTNVRNPDLWSPESGWRTLNGIDFIDMRQRRNELGRENVFPLLSLTPSGQIYHFWDTVENHLITPSGNGNAVVANADVDNADHAGGIQVMYDEGKLLISGNNDGSWGGNSSVVSNEAFTVDLTASTPVIRATQSMNFPRKFHQMISLPTGEVLVVGGNTSGAKFQDNGSILDSEIWNPETGNWRVGARMSVPRDYHSTALLMQDGRVITAGGGYHPSNPSSGGTHQDAQIYSPPYLYTEGGQPAARPTVATDFTELGYGQTVGVSTSGAVSYFSMIKMSATTHAINTDARFIKPEFRADGSNRYLISMHDNPNVATPGYWMLFAVDDNGVPSIAEIIHISEEGGDPNNGESPVVSPISSDPVPINEPSQFDVTAAGIGLLYSWNFGDGTGNSSASSQSSISHTFAQPGRYLVSVTVTDPAGNETVASFTQLAHIPTTASRPAASSALAEITSLNEIWNVNPDNDSVGVLSTIGLNRRAVISVGENPRALAIAPDGRVWVVNKNDATVSVIDTETRLVQQLVSLKPGSRPHGIVFAGNRAYIALEGIGEVVQLNAITGAEIQSVSAGGSPRHLSVNASNTRLYVSTFITPPLPGEGGLNPDVSDEGGEVLIYTISDNTLSASGKIVLQHSNRSVSEFSGPGLPNYLGPAVISPDGLSAWVPSKQDNILAGVARGGEGMTFDQTVRAVTSYIDLVNETEILASRVDHDNASVASHAAFDPFGLTLFTSLEGNRQIAMIDVNTSLEIARFDAGRATQSLLVSADGQRLYSHDFLDRSVSVFDIGAVVYQGDTETPLLATVNMSSGEALPSNVLQGKRLFYDARDDRLAALNYMSCASCHNEAGHDGRTWDFTGLGEGLRNTIGLQGAGGMQNGLLHWSANFDELQDFEEQIRNFAGGSGLMSDSDFNEADRAEPLGLSKAGISTDLDALAAYLSSLDKEFISPYRNQDGSLTSEAIQGQTLFANAGCASCHTGDKFTDSIDTPNLHNIGTLDAASGSRLSETLDGIDTPTLLGVWSTPPYLHNGAALSIADAIRAHNTQTLNSAQLATLSAFVRQLSSIDAGVGGNPPTLTIQAPLAASTFEETELVSFQAVASDIEDGDISDSVAWLSNLDGALGTGNFTSLLSVGTHDIVASITDSEGLSETTSVVITVEQSSSTVLVSTQAAVVGSNNDAEQSPTGRMRITSSDLELVFDANGNQLVGMRFTDLEIPQGVEVVNAYLQFQADETHSISTNLNVVGEASDDSLVFTNLNGNISARPVTGASVSWSPSAWDQVGEATNTQRSPNLNRIIQEIVTRPGWESGNALSIIVSGTGERVAESYDGSISGAPRLFVDYLLEDAGGLDTDGDGIPDSLDSDDDNDGFADSEDAFPLNASEWLDSDNDNIGNNADLDDDNDSVADLEDDFPLDATEWLDTDGDGIGNNADPDDDNDGALDDADPAPLDPAIGGSGILQIQSAVRSSADDAEERNSGMTNVRSTDLELVFDAGGNQQVGVRFNGVEIPRRANIVSAYIQFQADETGSAPTSLTISGEAIDNAAQYQSIANNISSRAKTAASVNWSPAPWTIVGQAGPDQRTPNLASLLQEIIARPGWVSGNSMAFIFEGSGERVAESFNGFPEAAPRLFVEYAFTNVDGNVAPTIDAGNDVSISVSGTASLSASITDDGLPVAPGLVSSVWSRVTGPGSVVFSPDNTASTTATFSQPGTYVLQITATDGQLSSFDQLTAVVAGESGSTVIDTRIVTGNDDAEERADGRMYLGSSDLEMTETARAQTIGLRFDSQQIPAGSTILRAYVQFQTDEVSLVPTDLLLHGEYSADAEVFSQLDDDLTSRTRTSAATSWAPATWTIRGAAGSDQQSPDLSAVIQEIINHPSWSEGNAIAILVTGTGTRTAESFEGSPSGAPLLHIEFQ